MRAASALFLRAENGPQQPPQNPRRLPDNDPHAPPLLSSQARSAAGNQEPGHQKHQRSHRKDGRDEDPCPQRQGAHTDQRPTVPSSHPHCNSICGESLFCQKGRSPLRTNKKRRERVNRAPAAFRIRFMLFRSFSYRSRARRPRRWQPRRAPSTSRRRHRRSWAFCRQASALPAWIPQAAAARGAS